MLVFTLEKPHAVAMLLLRTVPVLVLIGMFLLSPKTRISPGAKSIDSFASVSKESLQSSADYPPTDQQLAVFAELKAGLDNVEKQYSSFLQSAEWKSFNKK